MFLIAVFLVLDALLHRSWRGAKLEPGAQPNGARKLAARQAVATSGGEAVAKKYSDERSPTCCRDNGQILKTDIIKLVD